MFLIMVCIGTRSKTLGRSRREPNHEEKEGGYLVEEEDLDDEGCE